MYEAQHASSYNKLDIIKLSLGFVFQSVLIFSI